LPLAGPRHNAPGPADRGAHRKPPPAPLGGRPLKTKGSERREENAPGRPGI
jgi:hypothetical protein